jgi:ADP-ribose pyrophosphatase
MIKKLRTISSEIKISNPYWQYGFDTYELPNGKTGEYHYVSTTGSTMIIPRKSNGDFIMGRQYRYLNDRVSYEFPGGGIKKGLEPLENAREELLEEAGVKSADLKEIGRFNPYNGVTNEICYVFLAEALEESGAEPEESEQIEIVSLSEADIEGLIRSGEFWDGMSLASWLIYRYSKFYKG